MTDNESEASTGSHWLKGTKALHISIDKVQEQQNGLQSGEIEKKKKSQGRTSLLCQPGEKVGGCHSDESKKGRNGVQES